MKLRASLASLLAALAMSGCTGSLLETDRPANTHYVLAPAPAAPAGAARTDVDLTIGRPEVAPGLDTERIAVLKGRQLDYYRSARWGASAPQVVQSFLVDSLEDQRLFRSVTAEQARVAGDYVLDVTVRDFQAEYAEGGGAPSIRITMVGRVIRVADRQLVATVLARSERAASADRMHAVVAAFEASAQEVAVDLAQQTATAIASNGAHEGG